MSDEELAIGEVTRADDFIEEEQGERRAELLAGIGEALAQVERGETHTIEEVREMMKEWVRR